jgi:predicted PurR-regulated permease PerM
MTERTQDDAIRHAERRWTALGGRLRTVTPEAIARSALALGTIAVAASIAVGTWPALAPFLAGGLIAYAVLPIANRLDAFMPRVLAALLAELAALAVLAAIVVVIAPPLANSVGALAAQVPTGGQVEQRLADLQAQLGTLPDPARPIVTTVAQEVATNIRGALAGATSGIAAFLTGQILGIFETASFVLGLLVVPVWILTLVSDERRIRRSVEGAFAPAIRRDASALIGIVDRSLGTFLRVQVVAALATSVLIWLGLTLAESAGLISVRYEVAAAAILGVVQLIPQLGFLLGFLPLLLVLAISGPASFLVALVVYVVANRLAGTLVSTSVSRGVLDVHPALMIPGLVAIGQVGLVALLVGAPLIVIARDTVRYLNGRLSEPPIPAGLLPGTREWTARRARATARGDTTGGAGAGAVATPYVPSAYRSREPASSASARPAPAQPAPANQWSVNP